MARPARLALLTATVRSRAAWNAGAKTYSRKNVKPKSIVYWTTWPLGKLGEFNGARTPTSAGDGLDRWTPSLMAITTSVEI